MSTTTGEERVLTVFADVHYYFSTPTPRPLSHRFDKGSYLYLHRNSSHNSGRLEIANNVGKPEQDAFTGSLDTTKIQQSHKHPTLVTITVDGYQSNHGTASPPIQYPEHHWRLPNTDPRNEGKFLFRLHTLDIYFWTDADAKSFIDIVGKFLQQQQLEILDAPQPPVTPEQVMSPVVQQLENAAIQDAAYHNGQARGSGEVLSSFSPPPVPSDRPADTQKAPNAGDPGSYQPLAYNPAAPPAPEPIKHREKTPPPPESETGTGLAAAAYHDRAQLASSATQRQTSLSPSYSHMQVPQGYGSSRQDQGRKDSYASPPLSTGYVTPQPSTQEPRASSVSYFPPAPNPTGGNALQPYANAVSFAPPPQSAGNSPLGQSKPIRTSFSLPPQDPNAYPKRPDSPATEILGNSYVGGPIQPLQHLQPKYADYLETRRQSQKPEGGYSDYQYTQSPHHHQHHSHSNEYDVHNQVYKPTEEEAHKHRHRKHSESHPGQAPGKLEQKAEKVEKGVNRLFKKLEKKIG